MAIAPLSGIRVLDFTAFPPGGGCSVMLADLGAEIIRVESPAQKGQPSLVIRQVALSRGKKSITLDMRNPEAIRVLERLLPTVDVILENAKPGQMEGRGFGYSQASAINPGIIWCAITGFGQDGPAAGDAGHDLSYVAHSGLLGALTPDRNWQPGSVLALPAGSMSAVIGIQAALIQRGRTGEGAMVDISLSEAAGWFLTHAINPFGEQPFYVPASPDRRLYACSDGRQVAVASCEPKTWSALCSTLGVTEYADQLHKWSDMKAVIAALDAIFATRPARQWAELLTAAGATATMVNIGSQIVDDPQVQSREAVIRCGDTVVPANPVRMTTPGGETLDAAINAPPTVGEHNGEILRSAGFPDEEIALLEASALI